MQFNFFKQEVNQFSASHGVCEGMEIQLTHSLT